MPDEKLEQVKDEIQRGLLFLSTISETGTVHSALFPILDRLREQFQAGDRVQPVAPDTVPVENMSSDILTTQDHETIIIAIHKAMCEEAFICIYEKPNSVPGFAAAVRGKAKSIHHGDTRHHSPVHFFTIHQPQFYRAAI